MAIDTPAVLERLRELIAQVDGIQGAYVTALGDENGIPGGLPVLPAALIREGATTQYILSVGQHRKTYEVEIQLFMQAGESAIAHAALAPIQQGVMGILQSHVALGGLCNLCVVDRDSGDIGLDYAGKSYAGRVLTLRVSEQANAIPAYGSES
jgi:hypothetical protein